MKETITQSSASALEYLVDMAVKGRLPRLVTISGGTCSGKTTLSKKLSQRIRAEGKTVAIVPLDAYFLDSNDPAFPTRDSEQIFDVPEAYHGNEFALDTSRLCDGVPIELPVYDVRINRRTRNTEKVSPADFNIAEGLLAAHFLANLALKVFHVYMDTLIDECLQRRVQRDTAMYNVSESCVTENFKRRILPFWHIEQHQKKLAHLIVS